MSGSSRFFQPSVPEGFQWVMPTVSDYDVFMTLDDPPSATAWEPIHMSLLKVDEDRGRQRQHAYLPWLGSGALVLRDEAIEIVGALLQPHGELLPLASDEARLTPSRRQSSRGSWMSGAPTSFDSVLAGSWTCGHRCSALSCSEILRRSSWSKCRAEAFISASSWSRPFVQWA